MNTEHLTLAEADDLARAINQHNAATSRRAEAALHMLGVVALAALGAWALVTYLTPCEAGSLCMAAAVTPTRRGLKAWAQDALALAPRRLGSAARGAYLRWLIRCHENDAAALQEHIDLAQWEVEHLPQQQRLHRQHIQSLRCELAQLERAPRAGA